MQPQYCKESKVNKESCTYISCIFSMTITVNK